MLRFSADFSPRLFFTRGVVKLIVSGTQSLPVRFGRRRNSLKVLEGSEIIVAIYRYNISADAGQPAHRTIVTTSTLSGLLLEETNGLFRGMDLDEHVAERTRSSKTGNFSKGFDMGPGLVRGSKNQEE